MKEFSAIRCPEERKHFTSSGDVEYPTCGHLLAVYKDGYIYLRCPVCKQFWKIDTENLQNEQALVLEKVPKKLEMKLKNILRAVI